ncbi:MAG: winged helix-turn-helix transcriptional regulator [Geobacteraceae bacterium]|nr:winged helix-turn-helix transcriptional regulator [Geobacteraceae bacterium]
MNDHDEKMLDTYRSFLLISEIAKEESLSQRELAQRLGIALGLVNSYLKNLIAKGYVRVKNFPRNRYSYLLTPQGVAEKSRLAYQHLRYFTNLYTTTRQDYLALFHRLGVDKVRKVAFCGMDEVTEIAYLSLLETDLTLVAVMDDEAAGRDFFGLPVVSLADGVLVERQGIILTSLKKEGQLRERLRQLGAAGNAIFSAADGGSPGTAEDAHHTNANHANHKEAE